MLIALAAALSAVALAADVLVYAPEGAPPPGGSGAIEVVVVEAGRLVEGAEVVVTNATGARAEPEGEPGPGRYRFRYRAPADERVATLTVRVGGELALTQPLALAPAPTAAFDAPSDVDAAVGTPRIELRFPRRRGAVGSPDALLARASEGRVLEVRAEPDAVVVAVEPSAERQARVMAVGLIDLDDPRGTPTFALVKLRARPQLTLTAEPGSSVLVRVGKRSYGPFVADASGAANLAFDAWPGETAYEITVSDDLGNSQRSQGPLPSATRPVLVGVEAPRGVDKGADVWLGAWGPSGAAWTGPAPLCRSGAAGRAEAAVAGKGLYRAVIEAPEGGALFDPRVECALSDASVALRVPLGAERAERIELRVYPEALSADFPIAQVQAALLDRRGERLSPESLRVTADVGELQLERAEGSVRGEYRGALAVERGGDVITAAWDHPSATGVPWSLALHAGPDGAGLVSLVRALDRQGRPVAGAPVRVGLGDLAEEAVTDARGWARLRFGGAPTTLAAIRAETSGGVAREVPWIPGQPASLPDPAAPDLTARFELPIRAGRVRQVFLDVEPRPLLTGTGAVGKVVVRMLDAAGNPVRDEPVTIGASAGEVGVAAPQADGSLQARYTPPPGLSDQTVRITATTSAGTVATDLALAPRPVNGAVSLSAGWISNFGVVSAPTLSFAVYQRIPLVPRILSARLGVSAYALDTSVDDPDADETIRVRATLVPFDIGVQVLERWGRRSLHAGIAAVVAPYAGTVDFGDVRGVSGVGLASPGLSVHGGAGYRLGSSELFVEGRFLLYTASTSQLAFDGSVGGLSLAAGYRLLY